MLGEKGIHLKTGCSINMSSSHKSAIISKQMRKKKWLVTERERKRKGFILNLFIEWPALKEGHPINKFSSPKWGINCELTKTKPNLMINKTFKRKNEWIK